MKKAVSRSVSLLALAASLCSGVASAYPERPIRLIALNPPGGVSDTIARAVGEHLAEAWKQSVVVDNRVGASGIIGSEIVARSTPDGHTLLLGFVGNLSINPGLYGKLPYDSMKDFSPVSLAGRSPLILVVHPPLPVNTVGDLVDLAKSRPGKLAYSSAGNGNGNHLATELFANMAGVRLLHVPYKGGPPGLTGTMQGETAMMFANSTFAVAQVRNKRVRAIAVSTDQRLALLPDVPTVRESGLKDFVVTTWFGVLAPARTPQPVIRKLHQGVTEALGNPAVVKKFDNAGLIVSPSTPGEFGALIKSETIRWGEVIRRAGVTAN